MDYKKKYEEAVKKLKKFFTDNDDRILYKHDIETVFPELKENEDESWIPKEIIKYLKEKGDFRSCWIAWLEKQGEQKPVLDNTLKEAFNRSRKDYSLEEKKEASDYSESIIPTSIAYGESEEEYMLHKIIEAAFIAGQNIKQKPAWSEDDEYNLNWVIRDYEKASQTAISSVWEGHFKIIVDWLKSLKEKVQPQPKQEWSEEDEEMFDAIIADIQFTQKAHTHEVNQVVYEREIDWFKSIKERMEGE